MKSPIFRRRRLAEAQQGYILLSLVLVLTVMLIGLMYEAPRVATQIQRDREMELLRRGNDYKRAIGLYFRRFGRYPTSIEQLENTNNMRFLRRRWTDPITGQQEWRIIRFGEQKVQPRIFGQAGGQAGTQQPGIPAAALGGQQPGTRQPRGGTPPFQPGAGQPIGGQPVVGVSSTSERESLLEPGGMSYYNQWEFVYDPRLDPVMLQRIQPGVQGRPGQPGQPVQPPGPTGPGGGRFGTSPTPTPQPQP